MRFLPFPEDNEQFVVRPECQQLSPTRARLQPRYTPEKWCLFHIPRNRTHHKPDQLSCEIPANGLSIDQISILDQETVNH